MTEPEVGFASRVAELIDRLSRLTRELQYVHGLNPAQWEALRFIDRANRYSRNPGALSEFLGASKGTVSQTLISLENKGYINRNRSKTDRRVIELALTERGVALLDLDPVVKIAHMVENMGAGYGVPLVGGLSRLLHDLQVEVGAREFGGCELCDQFRHEGTRGAPSGAYRCGLTGETLSESEVSQLCVNFAPAEPPFRRRHPSRSAA